MYLSVWDVPIECILDLKDTIIYIAWVRNADILDEFGILLLKLCVSLMYDGYILCPFICVYTVS